MRYTGYVMARTKNKHIVEQFVQYMVAGGAFFWSGYAAFAVFDGLFGLPLFIAKQLANLIGLTVNYVLQDRWVFTSGKKKSAKEGQRGARYGLLMVINFGIDYLIVAGLNEAGLTPYLGQFVSAGFFTIWNFVWYKYWVFAHHPPAKRAKKRRRS